MNISIPLTSAAFMMHTAASSSLQKECFALGQLQ